MKKDFNAKKYTTNTEEFWGRYGNGVSSKDHNYYIEEIQRRKIGVLAMHGEVNH